MNALANWLGITDQNAPRDYDSEANRAGFWDTVRQMSALAIAAGAKQSDASRAQILGQLANVSSPTAGATRYAQANMQNMAAQRQREQYAADQNFSKGLDTMAGLNDQQKAILRAMGPGAREAYAAHGMNTAFEDPTQKMLRMAQMQNLTSQAELHKMQVEQAKRDLATQQRFLEGNGLGASAGTPPAAGGMPGGMSVAAPATAGGAPPTSASPVAPQGVAMPQGAAPQGARPPVGLSRDDIVQLYGSGMKTGDIMKKHAELIADQTKPPPGYQWADANRSRLMPIPGGEKEQVAGEIGSRLAQGEVFLSNLPQIREAIGVGNLSGVGNSAKLALGLGAQKELWRQIDQGMEAIVRLNTGAGQNGAEMIKAAQQYEPSALDSKETLLSKLNGLEAVLKQSMERVYQGRGGRESRPLPNPTEFVFDENKRAAARVNAPRQEQAAPQANSMRPGTVMDGHVYLGGNPADQSSWRPISEGYAR